LKATLNFQQGIPNKTFISPWIAAHNNATLDPIAIEDIVCTVVVVTAVTIASGRGLTAENQRTSLVVLIKGSSLRLQQLTLMVAVNSALIARM